MQKKDPKYSDLKEETSWTMEQFKYLAQHSFLMLNSPSFSEYVNKYLSQNKKIETDWILTVLPVSLLELNLNKKKDFFFVL